MPLTEPTLTPAMRTSSPLFTPVTSVKTALYSSVLPKVTLPMVIASRPVASVVTITKMISFQKSWKVLASKSFTALTRSSPPLRVRPDPA